MLHEISREDSIEIRVWCLNRLLKKVFLLFLTEASTWLNAAYNTVFNVSQKVFSLFLLYMVLPCSLPFALHLSTNVFSLLFYDRVLFFP